MKVALYAGSFDPVTNGHMWMIERGSMLYDRLIVAVGTNPDKKGKYMFDATDRLIMLMDAIRDELPERNNIVLAEFEGKLQINYAREVNANFLHRGVRNSTDYEYERQMMLINHDIAPEITTVTLYPPANIAEISSSTVKGLIGYEGWENVVIKYVPANVFRELKNKAEAK